MEEVKKMVNLFKSEKCWDYRINIKENLIYLDHSIYKIPQKDKRDYSSFTYYFDKPKIKYYCWRESHHNGDHWDDISKTVKLSEDEKEKIDKKVVKILRNAVKKNIESKVVDIMCNMYIDKKIEEINV